MEFGKIFRGYDTEEVDNYIRKLVSDFEAEIENKKEIISGLTDENQTLRTKLTELSSSIEDYKERAESVGIAMIKAEEAAKLTIADAERKRQAEIERVAYETKKWEERSEEVRHQLMEFEEQIAELLEKYQSEVSYLASKDIKKTYFREQKLQDGKTA